jgi:hypothetical protein
VNSNIATSAEVRARCGPAAVSGFIPKTGRSDLPSDAELGRLIRERIRGAIS